MSRPVIFAALLALVPAAAAAEASVTITFDIEDVITSRYSCGKDEPFTVVYVAADTDVLALVPIDGVIRVFAQAVSGSGARYVSGQYEWITKGESGTLTDTLKGETVLDCGPAER